MASETTPLLPHDELNAPSAQSSNAETPQAASAIQPGFKRQALHHWRRWKVLYLGIAIILSVDFSGTISIAPGIRLLETLVCRNYYLQSGQHVVDPGKNIPDELCGMPEVQGRLANIRGTLSMMESLPGILLGVPYGILADSRGRRLVMGLVIVGAMMAYSWALLVFHAAGSMPLWTIYLYPIFLCIGGGAFVIGAVLMATIADVVPAELRTKMFFLLGVLGLSTMVVVPPISSWIMDRQGPLFTYSLAIPLLLIPLVLLAFTPETGSPSKARNQSEETQGEESSLSTPGSSSRAMNAIKRVIHGVYGHIHNDILPILRSSVILRGLFGILVVTFSDSSSEVLMQYMHVRFKWRYEEAVSVLSFQALAHIIVLCTAMPILHSLFVRYFHEPQYANLLLMKVCVFFHLVGTTLMGFSKHPSAMFIAIAVSMIGSGFGAAARSFLTSQVPKNETALLYTLFSIFAALGTLSGAPLLSLAFSIGIKAGGWLIGMPFFLAALLYAVCAMFVWSIRAQQLYVDEVH